MSHTPCGSSADVFVPPPRLSVLCLCSVSLFCVSVLCLSVLCLCSVSLFCVSVLCLSAVLSLCSLCSISLFCSVSVSVSVCVSVCSVSLSLSLSSLSLSLVSYPRLYTRHITINADCTHGMSLQITPTDPVTRGVQGRCTRSRCCSAYPRGAGPSPTQPRACSSS